MNTKISIMFTVAGDPAAIGQAELLAMKTGAIEIGVPFSDPVAESPGVQKANLRALAAGAKDGAVEAALAMAKTLRTETDAKIVLYSYYNPVFRFGLDRFFKQCSEVGVDGVTLTDLPFEEQGEAKAPAATNGVALLSTIATTDTERAKQIASVAEGYLRIEPVGSPAQLEAVLAVVKEIATVPFALCQLSPEA